MSDDMVEHDPRLMARGLPEDALIVALVYDEEAGDESAAVADSLAMQLGRQREHTLLMSAASGSSPLDLLLGGADGEGLPGALQGRARLTDVAIQPVDRPFVYLPAGRRSPQMTELLAGDLFASFAERVRERRGTLLVLLPEPQLNDVRVRDLLDGYVALGDTVPDARPGLSMYGRLQLSGDEHAATGEVVAPVADDGSVAALEGHVREPREPVEAMHEPTGLAGTESEPRGAGGQPSQAFELGPIAEGGGSGNPDSRTSSWRRHRVQVAFPRRRVAIGVGAVAVLVLGWWLIGNAMRGPVGAGAEPTMSAPSSSADEAGGVTAEPEVPALTPAEAEAAAASAPELPYSVLVASYAARSDAEDRLGLLRRGSGGPYFVVPTLIRGALYHRVFAGARPDAESARELMTELVDDGRKDDASSWHIRPARFAYLLAAYGTRGEAEARLEAVTAAGLPAYILSAAVDEDLGPDSVFQVYAGAYESPVAARALIPLLESAGEEAELVNRRGRRP